MDCENIVIKSVKQYKKVPPDGGWAYMIWIAVIINFSVATMFLPSMGMIFNDFYIKLGLNSVDIQLVNGVNSISVAIGSFLTGQMTKMLSMRKISFIGSTCASAGVLGIAFVDSYAMLIVTQGIFMGAGIGISYNVACTSLNNYFLEKRFIMTSLAHTISAGVAMVTPLAVHWTAEHYGFRGTVMFMAAMFMQTLVGSSLQQPVKWHLRRVSISAENKDLLDKTNSDTTGTLIVQSFQTTEINIDNLTPTTSDNKIMVYIKDAFDWYFVKQILRTCACVGAPLSLASDVMFTLFIPQALYVHGWKEVEVAWALSLLGFGDIATRIFLIIASSWLEKLGNTALYIFGMVLEIFVKLVLLWFPHPMVTYVTLTLAGCSRCLLIVLFSLVVSDAVPPEKFSTAFGVSVLIYGTISITLGPAVGAVRDATGDYTAMFYILIALMAGVAVAWCIEIYCKNKYNRTSNKDS